MRPVIKQFQKKAHRSQTVRLFPYALSGIAAALLLFCLLTSVSFAPKPVAVLSRANRALSPAVTAFSPAPAVHNDTANSSTLDKSSVPAAKLINLNTASAEELQTLPGIGKALSQAIIDYRTTVAPFAAIEDVKQVKGIGDKRFDAIRALICVN